MSKRDLQKEKIREKYAGASPEFVQVIPAVEQVTFYEDDSEKNVAVYVRVSTDDPRQTSSFELQQNHYRDMIAQHKGWTLFQIYADEGISGTSLKHRDAFVQMIQDSEDKKIDLIITKSVSRFARNVYDCIGYVRKLAALKNPVGVFFETENIYTLNGDSEMSLSFTATLAQEESRSKSNSMNLSYEMRFHRGILLTPELLGYDTDESGNLVINQEEATTVRLIFFMYLYGYSCQEIAETLMQLKRLTKRKSSQWSAGSVLSILQNERHCGDVLARKTWTPNYLDHKSRKNIRNKNQYLWRDNHEAIISRDDYIAVQRLIKNAKYGHKGVLPSLRMIDTGALKGFISLNPRWAGFRKSDYLDAAAKIDVDISLLEASFREHEAHEGDFDLRGYEIARGQFFKSVRDLSVTFSTAKLYFSMACLQKLNYPVTVEMLFDPIRQIFAVRTTQRDNRNGVSWLRYDGKAYHPKPIRGSAFLGTLFEILQWDQSHKYRIRGVRRQREQEAVLLFDLHDTEITLLPDKHRKSHSDELTMPLPEDVQPLITSSQKHVIVYPADWSENFGTEYYRHTQAQELISIDLNGEWDVQHPGVAIPDAEGLQPSTQEQLKCNMNDLLTTMREEVLGDE